jgi:hypothetical protein
MYKILTASADTYITNKVLNNATRATDANMGNASTIDIFKLYDESSFTGHPKTYTDAGITLLHSVDELNVTSIPIELSRGLVKFDLSDISSLDPVPLTDFSCVLKLYDVFGGQTTPSNFSLLAVPLSLEFDEGAGRDVESFDDLDVCNFLTASYSSGVETLWGTHPEVDSNLCFDITSEADIENISTYGATQEFETGQEDLSVDVTTAITAMLAGTITNNGFRISFIQSEEQDSKTRFVKRFVSRHSNDKNKTPRLIIKYNDAATDATDVVTYTNYQATILNLKKEYKYTDKVRLHVFVEDRNYNLVESAKLPLANKGKLIGSSDEDIGVEAAILCYSITDVTTGEVIIPFDSAATVVSYDLDEMYFVLDTSSLSKGSAYSISFRIYEDTSSPVDGVYDLQYTIGDNINFKVV